MVPSELKQLPQWIVWRLEERDGKPTKVPYRADGAGLASTTDPATWSPAAEAWATSQNGGGYNGVGFVFAAGDPYLGIDLDHCIDEDGYLEDWASVIVDRLDSYTEISPSGRGLHVFVRAALPGRHHRKGDIEFYDRARYFTMTGRRLEGTPETVQDRQQALEALYAELFPPAAERPAPAPPTGLTGYELVRKATAAANGQKFDRLMRGDLAEYGSGSEADLALASMVAFWNPDPGVIEQVLRMSALWDEKWERDDYRRRTIEKALQQSATYDPAGAGGEVRSSASNIGSGISTADVGLPERSSTEPEGPWLTPLGVWLDGPEERYDWLVEGLLIRGGIGVCGAKPKVGKTTLLHQLALSVARGQKFLGRDTKAGPVIYLALEEDRTAVIDRFRRLGARSDDPVHLLVGQAGPEGLQRLRQAIEELGAVLAIVDPIQRLMRLENINDYSEVSNATDPLIAIARKLGCVILFSHHLGKMDRDAGDQVLGSTALFGSVDTAIAIRKDSDGTRKLETVQRYGKSLEPVVLGHDELTGAAWVKGPAEDFERERDRLQVMKCIADSPEPLTRDDLLNEIGMSHAQALGAVRWLIENHAVETWGSGRRGDPKRFRALRRPEDIPTTYLNAKPAVLTQNGFQNGVQNGKEFGVFKNRPHGFRSPLKGVENGNPAPISEEAVGLVCPGCGREDYEPLDGGLRRCLRRGCGFEGAFVEPQRSRPRLMSSDPEAPL